MIAIFPNIQSAVKRGDVEALSILIRKNFLGNTGRSPRLPLDDLLESIGVQVMNLNHSAQASLLARDRRGKFEVFIALNVAMDESDRSFILAYLLGHYFLHFEPKIASGDFNGEGFSIPSVSELISGLNPDLTEISDDVALAFAGALLLPKGMYLRAKEKLHSVGKLANFFKVPKNLVLCRESRIAMIQPGISIRERQSLTPADPENPPTSEFHLDEQQKKVIKDLAFRRNYLEPKAENQSLGMHAPKSNVSDSEQTELRSTKVIKKSESEVQESSVEENFDSNALKKLRKIAKTFDDSVEI